MTAAHVGVLSHMAFSPETHVAPVGRFPAVELGSENELGLVEILAELGRLEQPHLIRKMLEDEAPDRLRGRFEACIIPAGWLQNAGSRMLEAAANSAKHQGYPLEPSFRLALKFAALLSERTLDSASSGLSKLAFAHAPRTSLAIGPEAIRSRLALEKAHDRWVLGTHAEKDDCCGDSLGLVYVRYAALQPSLAL